MEPSEDWCLCCEAGSPELLGLQHTQPTEGPALELVTSFEAQAASSRMECGQQYEKPWWTEQPCHATLDRKQRLQQAGRAALEVPLRPCEQFLRLLVVGEAGSGKSTLIDNLFHPFQLPAGSPGSMAATADSAAVLNSQGGRLPASSALGSSTALLERASSLHPGLQVLEREFAATSPTATFRYHIQEIRGFEGSGCQPNPGIPSASQPDCRIDACLLLLPPHHLPARLAKAALQLADVVPVLPLLAKVASGSIERAADTLTAGELVSYRAAVTEALSLAGPMLTSTRTSELVAELDAACAWAHTKVSYPLSVIGGGELDSSLEGYWPVRRYAWGTVEVFDNPHSDVLTLRHLLLESGFQAFKDATDARHRQYILEKAVRLPSEKAVVAGTSSAWQQPHAATSTLPEDSFAALLGNLMEQLSSPILAPHGAGASPPGQVAILPGSGRTAQPDAQSAPSNSSSSPTAPSVSSLAAGVVTSTACPAPITPPQLVSSHPWLASAFCQTAAAIPTLRADAIGATGPMQAQSGLGIPPEFQELRVMLRSGEELTLSDAAELGSYEDKKVGQGPYLRLHTERLQVFVKGSRTTAAELWPWQSVWELKLLVQQHQGIPARVQMLDLNGRHLKDNWPLAQCGVQKNTIITLSVDMPGGSCPSA
ncbi:hypothetical protein N2152v2_002875 [Parachlorella kessleri]